jgi:RNA polymerase sigma factor (sigma-70 family)
MQNVTDSLLVDKLKTDDNASFGLLYKFYFPTIASYIKQNNGNKEDAEDVFQEAIIVLMRNVKQPDFVLTAALKTYLYAIAKNIWLKRMRSNRLISVEDFEKYERESETFFVEINPEKSREEKVTSWLTKITEKCQRILKAIFFYQEPMDNVMEKMGWKNKHTAANQQYKCIQQVKKEKEREEEKEGA